jgi:alcohol dehydrogenase class IV
MRAGDIHDGLLSSWRAFRETILLSSESRESRAIAALIGATRLGLPAKLHTICQNHDQETRIMVRTVSSPRILRIGAGASAELPAILSGLGLSRPLIVSDAFLKSAGHVDRFLAVLASAGIAARAFCETVPEPTVVSIEAGIAALHTGDHDCVVALGGGSPIDSAKAIAVIGTLGGTCRDYAVPHVQDAGGLPIIAIPTTAGTGSEATRFTVIADEASEEKFLCAGLAYLPIAALVDYELTLTMPPRLTADTGIDALTHAIEAYVSRQANPFSDAYALRALALIAPNLRQAYREPGDRAAREAMMTGATLAGLAFSNASVALVHGMSRPIGALFHVPHGLSNAMLLPAVTRFSAPAAAARYATCARAMGLIESADDDRAITALLDELDLLNVDLSVPTPDVWGIDWVRYESKMAQMAEQAIASGSPGNNPRSASAEEMIAIYRSVFK